MRDLMPRDLPCYGRQPDFIFDTTQGGTPRWRLRKIAVARALCAKCPIRQKCLDVEIGRMLEGARTFGIYGGTTQAERGRLAGGAGIGPLLKPVEHGTHRGYVTEVKRKLPTCPLCREAHRRYKESLRMGVAS